MKMIVGGCDVGSLTGKAVIMDNGSIVSYQIIPCDIEGRFLLAKIPVLGWGREIKPGELAEEIAEALKYNKVVIVRGHGSFAAGQLLEEAYHYTTVLEESCHLLYLLKTLEVDPTK